MNRWRWKLITVIDRSPKWCWSSLVIWAGGDASVRHLASDARSTATCIEGSNSTCYCGKLRSEDQP